MPVTSAAQRTTPRHAFRMSKSAIYFDLSFLAGKAPLPQDELKLKLESKGYRGSRQSAVGSRLSVVDWGWDRPKRVSIQLTPCAPRVLRNNTMDTLLANGFPRSRPCRAQTSGRASPWASRKHLRKPLSLESKGQAVQQRAASTACRCLC